MCLIKIYKEIKEREKEDYLRETDEEIYKITYSKSLLNSITKHQKYLKINTLMKKIEKIEDKEELDKYIKTCIEEYHFKKWKTKSQSKELIQFMESK